MATQTIDFGSSLNLDQIVKLIVNTPDVRYIIEGEPGIGKSSMIEAIRAAISLKMGVEYGKSYVDVPNCDLGDIAMPVIDHETKTTKYYPNNRFGLHTGQPMVIMLDEFTKGADPVKNMLHPLLEASNPRLGDLPIPKGTIIFMTGNLSSDGVGDSLKAHSLNRVVKVRARKPDSVHWLGWAVGANIEPVVMAWVEQFPHALSSYLDGTEDSNPYIYQPRKQQLAFVTPRSLAASSMVVAGREGFNDRDTLICALKGAIGESAARDMEAFIDYQDQLPKWSEIVDDPKNVRLPESAGAKSVLVFSGIQKVTKDSIDPFMKYISRMEEEWQAAFAINISKDKQKQQIAYTSQAFADWVQENEDLL